MYTNIAVNNEMCRVLQIHQHPFTTVYPSVCNFLTLSYFNLDMLIDIRKDVRHQHSFNQSQPDSVKDQHLPDIPVDYINKRSASSLEPIIALVVIACNRPDYIRQTLDNLLK